MKRLLAITFIFICGIGYFLYQTYSEKSDVKIEWVSVSEQNIERTISERGMIAASNLSLVQTMTSGTIIFLRKDGERVKKGDVVARIDTSNYDDDIAEIALELKGEELNLNFNKKKTEILRKSYSNRTSEYKKKYEHAMLEKEYEFSMPDKEEMRKLEIQLELKQLDLEEADANLKRQQNLFNKGFLSKASLEPYIRRFETAKEKVKEAKLDIEISKKGITKERRVELEQNVLRAKADYERAEKRMMRKIGEMNDITKVSEQKIAELLHRKKNLMYKLENSTCYAKADGYIRIRKYYDWRSGGQFSQYATGLLIRERDVIAEIVDPGEMKVDVIFNESDFHRLKTGLKVEITLPTYSEKNFVGQLYRLGAIGKDRNLWLEELTGNSGVSMYNGEISFESSGVALHPGMSAMVKIFLEEPSKGLVIPRKALIEENGKFYAMTESNRVELKGRYIDEFSFEVSNGLKSGEKVKIVYQEGT